jgi:coenzyme F420-reducing hydrogenase alpha subunit
MTALGFRGAEGTDFVRVEALTRVEGEGGVLVRIEDGHVADVQLRIFEPPRFIEGILRGRSYLDPVDLTARVCGICPAAYQLSACAALEDALGIEVGDGPIRDLRLLLYCGEWIESHALHVYLLHAPDFLGYEHGLAMAADHPEVVARGLRLKKAGNAVLEAVGGRAIHPVNPRVGGFHRAPDAGSIAALRPLLEEALDDALATVRLVAGLALPSVEVQVPLVAVWHPTEYPMLGDRLVSSHGFDLPVQEWGEWFHELQVARSTALHASTRDGETYLTGPLARYTPAWVESAAIRSGRSSSGPWSWCTRWTWPWSWWTGTSRRSRRSSLRHCPPPRWRVTVSRRRLVARCTTGTAWDRQAW